MALQYGSGGNLAVKMNGPFGSAGGSENKITTIVAPVSGWKGGTSPFSQTVVVDGVTVNSKIDIQLSVEQLERFRDQDICFTTENTDGVVTLYAIGEKPAVNCEFQATIEEVIA